MSVLSFLKLLDYWVLLPAAHVYIDPDHPQNWGPKLSRLSFNVEEEEEVKKSALPAGAECRSLRLLTAAQLWEDKSASSGLN